MFGFSEICSNVTKFIIHGVNSLVLKIRQRRIEKARRLCYEREALARRMVEPLRRAFDYQELGRRLLMVDELPQAAYASYRNEFSDTVCNICGGMGDNCSHLSYISERDRVFEEADRVNDVVQLDFDEELDRDTNSAYREY